MTEEDEEFNRIEREAAMRNVKRTWVGLNNLERLNIWEKAMTEDNGKNSSLQNQPFVHYARGIEAKLKEKNNG